MTRILSIYQGKLSLNQGTPLRVRQLLGELANQSDIDLTIASVGKPHFFVNTSYVKLARVGRYKNICKIISYIRRNNIDVVIGHTVLSIFYLLLVRWLTNAVVVLEMHGFLEEEMRERGSISIIRYYFYKIIFGIGYSQCHLITTCSDTATAHLRRYNANTFTIYGGVDCKIFNPTIKSAGSICRTKKDIVIGYAGNTRFWQGLDFFIDSIQPVLRTVKKVRVVLILSGRNISLPVNMKNDPRVTVMYCLPHNRIPSVLIDCDILVIPRLKSTTNKLSFPSKLMEYMAMGKVVIASRTSDIHNIITHNVNGLLFEPGDKKEFVKNIRFAFSEQERRRLGKAAIQTASMYTWPVQVNRFIMLINSQLKLKK